MVETRFGALKELRRVSPTPVVAETATARTIAAPKATNPVARTTGKSSSQDFERLTVYVRKETKKAASRKWEDATGKNMSDLVEHLLREYLIT